MPGKWARRVKAWLSQAGGEVARPLHTARVRDHYGRLQLQLPSLLKSRDIVLPWQSAASATATASDSDRDRGSRAAASGVKVKRRRARARGVGAREYSVERQDEGRYWGLVRAAREQVVWRQSTALATLLL